MFIIALLFTTNSYSQGPWGKKDFNYYIDFTPHNSDSTYIKNSIATAFQKWSQVSTVTFKRVFIPQADTRPKLFFIQIMDHGDSSFGTEIAHTVTPTSSHIAKRGEIHFNESLYTFTGTTPSHSLIRTATHEIGHFLGLSHDVNTTSISLHRTIGKAGQYTATGKGRSLYRVQDS